LIKCFEPDLGNEDYQQVLETLKTKILGFGPKVSEFEEKYKKFSNKEYNIGFNSASSAALLLYRYLYEQYGACRVYTPSLGFVSPVTAATMAGHEVVYTDVDNNLLLSVDDLRNRFLEDKRKSIIMPILYGGVSDIRKLNRFCEEKKSILVLDSAHCISPEIEYDHAFYSFHPVKPICMSNGGLLATSDKSTAEYLSAGRNFGRKATGDTYDLPQFGFNFYMNNLNASLGISQLSRCLANVKKRKSNFTFLKNNIPSDLGYFTDHDKKSSYYLSTLVLKPGDSSAIMRQALKDNDIQASFHYPFLHKTGLYKQSVSLDFLDSIEDRIINLPIHQELSKEQLYRIVDECIRYSRSRC
jgi:dTDP-4-amino-4,6-dideoxygalactose transaminase